MKVLSSLVAVVMLTSTAMAADLDLKPRRAAPLPPPQQYSQPMPQEEQVPPYQPQYQPQMPFPQFQPQPQFATGGPICPRALPPPCSFGVGCGAQFAGGFGGVPWIGGPRFFGPRFFGHRFGRI